MRNTKPVKTERFIFHLTPAEKADLVHLSNGAGQSGAAWLRQAMAERKERETHWIVTFRTADGNINTESFVGLRSEIYNTYQNVTEISRL